MAVLRLLRAAIPAALPLSATAILLAQDVLQVAPQHKCASITNTSRWSRTPWPRARKTPCIPPQAGIT